MTELTDKQQEIFRFLQSFTKKYGYPPTVKEIMEHFNFASPTAVTTHLTALEKKGYVKKTDKRARGSVPIGTLNLGREDNQSIVKINLLEGEVKAGTSMSVADENIIDTFIFSKSIVQDENTFLMKVKGDSMIEAHIKENDMVLVHPAEDANNGEIVVCIYNDNDGEEITIKRFFKEKNKIKLVAENKNYKPIIVDSVKIVGKVTGVLRLGM